MRNPLSMLSRFLTLTVAGCLASVAQADEPNAAARQLAQERFTIVAPFPPGGPVDVLSRLLAESLQKRYGQAAVVENVPGGAGNPGMDRVRRARPSGHTLLVIPAGNLTINPTLMANFPFGSSATLLRSPCSPRHPMCSWPIPRPTPPRSPRWLPQCAPTPSGFPMRRPVLAAAFIWRANCFASNSDSTFSMCPTRERGRQSMM